MDTIETPNQVVTQPEKYAGPHLSEKELSLISQMQKLRTKAEQHFEWLGFQRIEKKPKRISKALTFNEQGEVVVCDPKVAPIEKGNLTKGTLRNKKCSCGSGRKYKKCCLLKANS